MSENYWKVDVDGRRHVVTVEVDGQSGRAGVRVDGRLTARPLTREDGERVVPIGSRQFVVRRLEGDRFDLDIPPEAFLGTQTQPGRARTPAGGAKGKQPGGWRWIALAIGALLVSAAVVFLLRGGLYGMKYMRVPWQAYQPEDRTFEVRFPTAPARSVESMNVNGDMWHIVTLTSQYEDHYYAVQHLDLHLVITDANAASVIKRFFDGWARGIGASVQSAEPASLARNPALDWIVTLPAGAGEGPTKLPVAATVRGRFVLRDKRLFLVWNAAASEDPFTKDLDEFLASFTVKPPPEKPDYVL